jgi:hypothetical protein
MVPMTETRRPQRPKTTEMEVSVENIAAAVSGKRIGKKIFRRPVSLGNIAGVR